ncbi:MAG: 16S rRNA (cytidine(1402)-2'-O)-methyltransferase [Saprospiraceae bacterium]|nr:16S rRNA (cytidine(1402)-2'-O)-methyltransferase [Pyrinomonadaceae bacterium]
MAGTLYLVATPIGNLQDISFRAIEILKNVEQIACEDTRHSRKLLNFYEISNKLVSYHEHNELERSDEFAEILKQGKSIAIISDAGTTGINDPGYKMVQKAYEIGATVVPIPGAVAFVNAAIASGLPTDSLFFGGFLPSKKGQRRKRLDEVKQIPATLAFYESPHRLGKSLVDCLDVLGNRQAAVARELTKLHEEIVRGELKDLAEKYSSANSKGEIVLVIERAATGEIVKNNLHTIAERVKEMEGGGIEPRAALKKAAKEFGMSKSEAYRILQSQKQ